MAYTRLSVQSSLRFALHGPRTSTSWRVWLSLVLVTGKSMRLYPVADLWYQCLTQSGRRAVPVVVEYMALLLFGENAGSTLARFLLVRDSLQQPPPPLLTRRSRSALHVACDRVAIQPTSVMQDPWVVWPCLMHATLFSFSWAMFLIVQRSASFLCQRPCKPSRPA